MPTKYFAKTAAASILAVLASSVFADAQKLDEETKAAIDLAEGFYEEVFVGKNLDNLGTYVADQLVQHVATIADGAAGLTQALESQTNADPDATTALYRMIAEGNYVGVHSVRTTGTGAQIVTVDIWRSEDGKLVEQWSHSQQVPDTAENENTMFEGPKPDLTTDQNIEQNRERAIAVLNTFEDPTDTSAITDFVSAETYIQHNPHVPDGRDAFAGYLDYLAGEGIRFETDIAKTIAMGDFVLVHSRQINPAIEGDLGNGYMDMFRFNEDGLIVEHWDVEEAQTEASANGNGVFEYPND